LVLLLVTFTALLVKDWDFWFGSNTADADLGGATQSQPSEPISAKTVAPAPVAPASSAKKHTAAPAEVAPASTEPVVTASRAVLPPLDVEVVAGDAHSTVRPGSNALSIEITKPGTPAPRLAAATNAADRERILTGAGTYEANYPVLAQQMKVQGSVVLQALVGADGVVQNLRVMSGPGILTSAAERAVRGWHFKPVLQNGQPVETKATITVNFTINVGDSTANIS
jgi:protein TonB